MCSLSLFSAGVTAAADETDNDHIKSAITHDIHYSGTPVTSAAATVEHPADDAAGSVKMETFKVEEDGLKKSVQQSLEDKYRNKAAEKFTNTKGGTIYENKSGRLQFGVWPRKTGGMELLHIKF